ncbi:MAG: nucleotidyltransferase domain-containing protein [Candidatus Nanoarchaeia archaeon]|nr:nucleotidyltransferase domain-containing protein [Candidatus Nanoarchaeia archaeon]MDD5239836.1 nucleotidyltransferase domain-containing protein [Candidatus Nanoarchaeia archaeon]
MAKAQKGGVTAFLKKFKKETLTIVEKQIEKEGKKSTVIIAVVNDLAFTKAAENAAEFTKDAKEFNILPLSGLWQAFFDGKYQLTEDIVHSKVIYDTGLINALKCGFAMREGLAKKFDKYLISLVLFGSWARGQAVKGSDVDFGVVIDDTDVKETTRVEIREKIRKIVLGIAAESGKDINVQVYILTQFWEYVRDANPVIFTLLRDGVPIFDKGLFSPWKLLLKMGKIKPTPEAIKSFIQSGNLLTKVIRSNLDEMLIEKLYYAMLNPAQAALMFVGIAPPAYGETPHLLKRYFVDKGLLNKKYVDWLDEIIAIRKRVEHDNSREVNGKLIDVYIARATEFSEDINKLFEKMKKENIGEKIKEIDYLSRKGMRTVLETLGVKSSDKDLAYKFKKTMVEKKVMPAAYTEFLGYFDHVKDDYQRGLVTQEEINRLEKNAHDFIEAVIGFAKIRELKGTDKFRFKIVYKDKKAEIWVLGNEVFIIADITHPESTTYRASMRNDGSLEKMEKTDVEELTKKRKNIKVSETATVKEKTIESLKAIFGDKVEIVID